MCPLLASSLVKDLKSAPTVNLLGIKKLQLCEKENLKIARKSLIANKKILKNEKFSIKNLTVKRPGTGVSSKFYFKYIGKKSKFNYKFNDIIKPQ